MSIWYRILLCAAALLYACNLYAQEDTTVVVLQEVSISGSRLDQFAAGDKVEAVSAISREQSEYSNLADVLSNYSGANIRSYGVSGLSTPSVRGTGSNHTAVFWEGVNLQSPTNGSLDLVLVPVTFVDDISLQYGGAGSLFGSGTLGGAIHLNTLSRTPDGLSLKLHQQLGSYGQQYTGLNINGRKNKLSGSIRAFTHNADNDFPYFNRYTQNEENQKNAQIDQHGILAGLNYAHNSENQVSAKYWYQDNLVHIPDAASGAGVAKATQADIFHRGVIKWQRHLPGYKLNLQTAFLHHQLNYDDQVNISSASVSNSWITEAEFTKKLRSVWLDAGVNNTYDEAEVDSYAGNIPSRNMTGLYMAVRMLMFDDLEMTVGIRETLVGSELTPVMPSLGMNYTINRSLSLKSKLARSYRVPTFNDLYWMGGGARGNPQLEPELGWSAELGTVLQKELDNATVRLELTGFSNIISQWIQWIEVDRVWSPVNVQKIWARGLEVEGKYEYLLGNKSSIRLWGSYSYTQSTKIEIDEGGNPAELDKQVIYTPIHQGKASADILYQNLTLSINQVYVGEQFTSGDNRRTLESYTISGAALSYALRLTGDHRLRFVGQVKNLLDKDYEVRNARPMPGRNYHLSIIYQFK